MLKQHLIRGAPIILALVVLIMPISTAVPYLGETPIIWPSAYKAGGQNLPVGLLDAGNAKSVNQIGTSLYGSGWPNPQMVWTANYTNVIVLPLANATIREVYACAIVRNTWPSEDQYGYRLAPNPRYCQLGYGIGGSSMPPNIIHLSTHFTIVGTYWQEIDWRITDSETWTPALVTGNTLWIVVDSTDTSTYLNSLEVDYVGLRYNWTYTVWWHTPGIPDEPPLTNSTVILGPLNAIGIFGLVGGLGIVAIPAGAIWLHKKQGGSSAHAAVTALLAWVLCLGLLLVAINY